jgi:hypothetical protein
LSTVKDKMPPGAVKELRRLVADAIAGFKAYDVPGVCKRLGLADGDGQEAFHSKFKYAHSRLVELSPEQVLKCARQLLSEEFNFQLAEAVAKIDERDAPHVTELTRRRIIAVFDKRALCTEGEEIDLIRRVWPIGQMPATNATFDERTLEDEIVRYTIRNSDWSNRELFEALGVLDCSMAQLFKFLSAVTHPLVQTPESQTDLVAKLDEHLSHDGYALAVSGRISGSPHYAVRRVATRVPADDHISAVLSAFDPGEINERWAAALERRATDPSGAITLARTLLEDVCKWVLTEAGETFGDADDLPTLYRRLSKALNMAPDQHTEQVFKQILGSCQSIVEALGAVRNRLGDAHSRGPKRARPLARHAELAVNLSGAMATFLVSTWQARQEEAGRLASA